MVAKGLISLKSYARKYAKRRQLEEQLEKLKLELGHLAPEVLRYFEKHGVDKQTIDGYTLSPRLQLWAAREEDLTAKDMHDVLIAAGLQEYVSENMEHQGFSAHIREVYRQMVDREQEKPIQEQRDVNLEMLYQELWSLYPELEGKLRIREDLKISVVRSKKSAARSRIGEVQQRQRARAQALPEEVQDDRID